MAGKKGRSGRTKLPGRLYRLYIRYRPGLDPPELEELLETMVTTNHHKRTDIFRAAVIGGMTQAKTTAQAAEASVTTTLLDEMFADF